MDLPADHSHKANPQALILADTITELDLFAPLPDPDAILRAPEERAPGQDPTLLDFGMSQMLDSQTPTRTQQRRLLELDDDDLGLDIGDGQDDGLAGTPMSDGPSIEQGRRAPTPRGDEPTMLQDDDLGLDLGFGADTTLGGNDGPIVGMDDDYPMGGLNNEEIGEANEQALRKADAAAERARRSESVLSSVRPSVERDLEETFRLDQAALQDETEQEVQAAQRVKRRKVMRMDNETELHNSQIKRQQEDRSNITKAPSFLPRDPLLLQLMEMQRNGSFVSNLMGDGRMQGWAPELRGILSLEIVRKAGDKKRKRDSGIVADVETDGERQESPPQLEIPQDEDEGFQVNAGDDFGLRSDGFQPGAEDDVQHEDEENYMYDEPPINFDITEAPLLHPSQQGAVALGTKKMVHMLRDHFAPDHPKELNEPPTPSKRVKQSALFTDLCPERTTTRQDATKMFFELLVLGTKDAIKVEQDSKDLGLPIRVRGKRGLWGDWAEMQSGGEIASQEAPAAGIEVEAAA